MYTVTRFYVQHTATDWMISGSSPGRVWEFFSSPPSLDWVSGPPSLLSNGYQRLFPGNKAAGAWSWPLTSSYCRGQECVELYLPSPQYSDMV